MSTSVGCKPSVIFLAQMLASRAERVNYFWMAKRERKEGGGRDQPGLEQGF